MQAAPGTHWEVAGPGDMAWGYPPSLAPGDPGLLRKSRDMLGWAEHHSQALKALPRLWHDEQIQINLLLERAHVEEGLSFTAYHCPNNQLHFTWWKPLKLC